MVNPNCWRGGGGACCRSGPSWGMTPDGGRTWPGEINQCQRLGLATFGQMRGSVRCLYGKKYSHERKLFKTNCSAHLDPPPLRRGRRPVGEGAMVGPEDDEAGGRPEGGGRGTPLTPAPSRGIGGPYGGGGTGRDGMRWDGPGGWGGARVLVSRSQWGSRSGVSTEGSDGHHPSGRGGEPPSGWYHIVWHGSGPGQWGGP